MVTASSAGTTAGRSSAATSTGVATSSAPALRAAVSTVSRRVSDGPCRAWCTATASCRPSPGTPAMATRPRAVASAPRSSASSFRAASTGTR
ncbi:hypothetical protein EEZ25_18635 [Micromonospora aurantiaca]|nr:hypothetical protein EEZ25_18635 [Micromonospora aurantiaca]